MRTCLPVDIEARITVFCERLAPGSEHELKNEERGYAYSSMVELWTRDQVRDRVVELVSEVVGIPKDRIGDEATLDNELQMTSVALIEVQVAIEEMFDVQLDPMQVVELNQFGAIVDYTLGISNLKPPYRSRKMEN